MALLCLEIEPRTLTSRPAVVPIAFRPPRLASCSSSSGPLPVKGFLCSILVHELAIAAMVLISPSLALRNARWHEKHWEFTMLSSKTIYLPQVGGGRKGIGVNPDNEPSSATSAKHGLTYPGSQAIVSNVPKPTNFIQTILQPDLPRLPILRTFVPLPNKVLVAHVPSPQAERHEKPFEGSEPVVSKPQDIKLPLAQPNDTRTVDAPKLTLPTASSTTSVSQSLQAVPPSSAPSVPQASPKVVESKLAPPLPTDLPPESKATWLSQLVISPVLVPKNAQVNLPKGEARGEFAISARLEPNPQDVTNFPSGGMVGAKDGDDDKSPDSKARNSSADGAEALNGGKGKGSGGSGNLSAHAFGSAGAGAGKIIGNGLGNGGPNGSGIGAGAGPGGGPFAGMTIQGAEGPVASVVTSGSGTATGDNFAGGSYGITIVSTGNSGGVEDLGVFHDEAVFTVYLDPGTAAGDPEPPWPLQYSILNPSNVPSSDVVPPLAVKKVPLRWPSDLSMRYAGQQIVLTAEIDTEGKIRQRKILQSPNPDLSLLLLDILSQWVFRPAMANGEPVALKIVLGVPIFPQR